MPAEPVKSWIWTAHAIEKTGVREVDQARIEETLLAPEQRFMVREGRDVLQSRFEDAHGPYLLRVFVDVDRNPNEVVTAYRTGKIANYWRIEP